MQPMYRKTLPFALLLALPFHASAQQSADATDLDKVVAYAKTVRNNLFHGGKHGHDRWDDPARMRRLLTLTITLLAELAALGNFGGDYDRFY